MKLRQAIQQIEKVIQNRSPEDHQEIWDVVLKGFKDIDARLDALENPTKPSRIQPPRK